MSTVTIELIKVVVEILLKDGIPAFRRFMAGLDTDTPTLADIERLKAEVTPLTEADFD